MPIISPLCATLNFIVKFKKRSACRLGIFIACKEQSCLISTFGDWGSRNQNLSINRCHPELPERSGGSRRTRGWSSICSIRRSPIRQISWCPRTFAIGDRGINNSLSQSTIKASRDPESQELPFQTPAEQSELIPAFPTLTDVIESKFFNPNSQANSQRTLSSPASLSFFRVSAP